MRSTLSQALALAATVAGLLVLTGAAAGGTTQRPVYRLPQSYYLALGDSMAYGFQTPKAKPGARASDFRTGYVDGFAATLEKLRPGIQVVNYGCPGESTVTFVRGGWNCDGAPLHNAFHGSQLAAAKAFLRAHPGGVSPITLTLWGGDLFPLTRRGKQAAALSAFAEHFSSILRQLRAAAPDAEIIVTGAWNPEADRIQQGRPLYSSVDTAIKRAASATRIRVAEMFPVFDGSGDAKAQQHRLCALTFYCASKGQDPHPTDAGYRAMADAFMTASGYPQKP